MGTQEPLSVSTLDDALRWLIVHANPEEWIFDPEADLPPAALFACDMFWISPAHLCKKLRAFWPAIPVVACCRFRGHEDKIVTKETEIGNGKTEVHEGVQV